MIFQKLVLVGILFILLFAAVEGCKRRIEESGNSSTNESVIVGPGQTGIMTKTGIVVTPK